MTCRDLSGTPDPELDVYCEDNLAELLIRESLPGPVRKRIRVLPVGSKANLAEQGAFHLRTRLGDESHMLLVWDGDVRQAEIDNFLRTAGLTEERTIDADLDHLNWTTLPGPAAPERWLLEVLDCDDGYDLLGYELGETGSSTCGVIERLKTVRKHHDVAYELGQMYGFSAHQALSCLVKAAARLPSRPLEPICEVVNAVLDGRRVYGNLEASPTS